MSSDEGAEFTLPTIPYFYHDIVARIIPGMIQIGLIAALTTYYSTGGQNSAEIQNLKLRLDAVVHASQLATALMLLAAAYFVGVVFEGLMFLCRGLGLYSFAFARASANIRRMHGVLGPMTSKDAARLAEETFSILESYEPLAPHFFARATRFLAEAKMMAYSALALPGALVVVGITTGHWLPPGGYCGIGLSLLLFLILAVAGFARQQRRALEILRCVQYLALRRELADASSRAQTAWAEILAPSSAASATRKETPVTGATQQPADPTAAGRNTSGST
jgi:hypothetical protein